MQAVTGRLLDLDPVAFGRRDAIERALHALHGQGRVGGKLQSERIDPRRKAAREIFFNVPRR